MKENCTDFLKCQVGSIYQPQANLCFTAGCHTTVIIQRSELCWSIGEAFAHRLTAPQQFPDLFFHTHEFLPGFHALIFICWDF